MKIIAIGRNYVNHAKEMKAEIPREPVFFLKPETALLRNNDPFYYPEFSQEIHYEIELVIKISKVGRHINKEFAPRYFKEIGLGIDFTARDIQRQLKAKGLPWEKAKAFDFSAPISKNFIPKQQIPDTGNINFRLEINGKTVQQGNSKDMIFSFEEIISYVSNFITLKIGDLIYTGTPAGVGSIKRGDVLKGYIEDKLMFDFEIL